MKLPSIQKMLSDELIGKSKVVFVSGNFNIVHPGHLRVLNFAASCGDILVVGVNNQSDPGIFVDALSRLAGVQAISIVDYAFLMDAPLVDVISILKPAIVVKGKEHEAMENPEEFAINSYGGKLIFASGETGFSSLDLLQKEFNLHDSGKNINIPKEFLCRHRIDKVNLIEILNKFQNARVAIVGDLIMDEYITCEALGMSQEDPTIVVSPIHNDLFIGGAGVVARHASSLGANVSFFSVVGSDDIADYANKVLSDDGVKTFLVLDESRPTTLKQRYRANTKTLLRVSHLKQHDISAELANTLCEQILSQLKEFDLLIFSDFNYGCLPQHLVSRIIDACKQHHIPFCADSQSSSQIGDISRFCDALLVTPTEREARLAMHDASSGLIALANSLIHKSRVINVLLTLGSEGVLIHSPSGGHNSLFTDQIPALNSSPRDVSGAGDSLLVVASMALVSGASIWEAAYLGSVAASCQVSRVGNTPLKMQELMQGVTT